MTPRAQAPRYQPTESKYKGGADEMYITYDLEQPTRGGGKALYPKEIIIWRNMKKKRSTL